MCIQVMVRRGDEDIYCNSVKELSEALGGPVVCDGKVADTNRCLCGLDGKATAALCGVECRKPTRKEDPDRWLSYVFVAKTNPN